MAVDSYLELFTTLYGWQFYNILWDVLANTGIVYLPFLGILIESWKDVAASGGYQDGTPAGVSLRRMEIEVFLAILVVVLAAQPASLTPLSAAKLRYTPMVTAINPTPTTATVASPDSTYGKNGFTGTAGVIDVPAWWYMVMAVSSGFNQATISGFPSTPEIRTVQQMAEIVNVQDERLRQEINDFFTDCYLPARSKFHDQQPNGSQVNSLLSSYGADDPNWMGSHVYRNTPGYYDTLRSGKQIPGWPYNPTRDAEYDDPVIPNPTWGKPICKEWWEDGSRGLREKMIADANQVVGGFTTWLTRVLPGWDNDRIKDGAANSILKNSPPVWSNNDFVDGNRSMTSPAMQYFEGELKKAGAYLGTTKTAIGMAVIMTIILTAIPIVQALLLFGMYTLLPMIVVLSRYSISMMVVGALSIFTVKFWTVLWFLAQWVDQNLIYSMYPTTNHLGAFITGDYDQTTKRMLLNMITASMYVGLPLLWSGMMYWAGKKIGMGLDGAMGRLVKPADAAGSQGGSMATGAVDKVAGKRR